MDGGALDFESKKSCDYHEEMNSAVYEKWFRRIVHLLPPNSVIVIDNASYHSRFVEKIPNTSTRKAEIIEWLVRHGVEPDPLRIKAELLLEVEKLKPSVQKRVIDTIAEEYGHTILRLPPYHCELNPIELVWAAVKQFVAKNNKLFKIGELRKLLKDSVSRITSELWAACVRHVVEKVEKDMWDLDDIVDHLIEVNPIVIEIGPNDSDSDASDNDSVNDSIAISSSDHGNTSNEHEPLSIDDMDVDDSGCVVREITIDSDWESD